MHNNSGLFTVIPRDDRERKGCRLVFTMLYHLYVLAKVGCLYIEYVEGAFRACGEATGFQGLTEP